MKPSSLHKTHPKLYSENDNHKFINKISYHYYIILHNSENVKCFLKIFNFNYYSFNDNGLNCSFSTTNVDNISALCKANASVLLL